MAVKFLSDEWMVAATAALGTHDGFQAAIKNVDLGMQFEVTGDAGASYYLAIGDGDARMVAGELENADVTVTNDYETATSIAKGDLNTQMAFMTGKLKVAGNMGKLLMHQALINQLGSALAEMDVDY